MEKKINAAKITCNKSEDIELNKNNNTLDMDELNKFTKQFIRKTRGMSKKDISFTVWEFGNWQWARGKTHEQERNKWENMKIDVKLTKRGGGIIERAIN